MNTYSKKVATALAIDLIKQAYQLKQKPKLSREELKALRRIRELASIVRATGV